MARGNRRRRADARYLLTFVGTAGLLVSGTLVLVLYVLPERYVLSSGFVEGNLNLPDPTVPFEPVAPRIVAALPPTPAPDTTVVRGPAEVFWEQVLPLIAAERWDDAIGLFALYLGAYPGDDGARREYALTLSKAGYADRAIPILERLLEGGDDRELRLLLARTLRDAGRVAEASEQYRQLLALTPDDEALILEHAGALAWIEAYPEAIEIVDRGLSVRPTSVPLRVERARLLYYSGDLVAASRALESLTPAERSEGGVEDLYQTVVAELTPPEIEQPPEPEPTLLDRAVRAREEGRYGEADALFRRALEAGPEDVEIWQAYADFLQYVEQDLVGALDALETVERLGGAGDPGSQYRMAQLEVWVGELDAADRRLVRLSPGVVADAGAPVDLADVLALRGDIARWRGDRPAAADNYAEALALDPGHVEALSGAEALRSDTGNALIESEQPGLGGLARSFADTDDFRRLDLGGEWRGIDGSWVWMTRSGARLMSGFDLDNNAEDRSGLFAELEGGRWWRSGTLRTVVRLGAQTVRSGSTDVSVGASARHAGSAGQRTDIDLDSEPAHVSANTLQSSEADVRQERLLVAHSRPLGEVWTAAMTGEAASLSHGGVPAADRNLRTSAAAALTRPVLGDVSAGVATRVLSYTDSAPVASGRSLYWDPEWSVAIGPVVRWERRLNPTWLISASATPGVGLMRERADTDTQIVPDMSGAVRALRDGARYRALFEVTYGQGRFSGYRSIGVNVSLAARGWTGSGGEP